ncbi:DNA-binding protein [Methylomonas paludis]|uniref:DNA-binding protein n=1 Tax=Methylomonas paludis TaxID=1173101 RepID=A0A975R7S8_9GAMM|nr:DNA-binding protein [Methylomonas paludis]QWF69575.1 DNA-binding protein [Methylomonas paludis]
MIDHDIASEARTRVFETATAIYEGNGKSKLPTVDQVRRSARVDMNAASALMREWRRNLLGEVKTVTVSIPEGLNSASTNLISELWCKAQALANEAIRAAESAWHVERAEMEFMREELATAYELQETEVERLVTANHDLENQIQLLLEKHEHFADAEKIAQESLILEIENLKNDRKDLLSMLSNSKDEAANRTKIIADIEQELKQCREDGDQARLETAKLSGKIEGMKQSIANLNDELQNKNKINEDIELELKQCRAERDQTRLETANLAGKIEGMQQAMEQLDVKMLANTINALPLHNVNDEPKAKKSPKKLIVKQTKDVGERPG